MQVQSLASLSGLRIWRSRELRCRSQMRLGSRIAVAVLEARRYSSDSTPSLGTSICRECGPKKTKRPHPQKSITGRYCLPRLLGFWCGQGRRRAGWFIWGFSNRGSPGCPCSRERPLEAEGPSVKTPERHCQTPQLSQAHPAQAPRNTALPPSSPRRGPQPSSRIPGPQSHHS